MKLILTGVLLTFTLEGLGLFALWLYGRLRPPNSFLLPADAPSFTQDAFDWKDACSHLVLCADADCTRCEALRQKVHRLKEL
jgi:hypothetical protein